MLRKCPRKKITRDLKTFLSYSRTLNIIKNLDTSVEDWNYQKLDETQRVSSYIKEKIDKHDFS